MKRYRWLLALLIIVVVLPAGVAADAPPFSPTLPPAVRGQDPRNPHPATTDIPPLAAEYTLAATIGDPGASGAIHVSGTEQVRLTNTGNQSVPSVTFNVAAAHYGWFTLDSGTIDGTPTAVDQAEVRFSFPDWPALAPGDTRTVGFAFHLDIGDGGDGFDVARRDGDILRLGYWFPMLSDDHGYHDQFDAVYTATGNFHVTLTAPASDVLASTGVIEQQTTSGAGSTYTIEAPNVRDFTALLSPAYAVVQGTTKDNVRVQVFTVPGHLASDSVTDAEILADAIHALEWMSATVGPYPYPIFSVVDAGTTMPGGVEFPMLVMIGTNVRGVPTQALIAHETAHQWFYGALGTHPQTETWVDEGAASLFEITINNGLDASISLPRPLPCPVNITVWDHSVNDRDHYYCVYNGGAKVYATIRDTMGSERFVAALHDLYTQDRYGIFTARDLLTLFQQHSATDLRPALHAYLTYDWLDALPSPGG
ncbi:MAG: M1 family aminopeptidase [Thermomicrobiales bacterium]